MASWPAPAQRATPAGDGEAVAGTSVEGWGEGCALEPADGTELGVDTAGPQAATAMAMVTAMTAVR
jgi:hypothetical protein